MTTLESTTPPSREILHFDYHGRGNDLAWITFKNLFLTLLTFGIYSPWATTEKRRFEWGSVSLGPDRVSYTGTGRELFQGWVKLLLFLAALGFGRQILSFVFNNAVFVGILSGAWMLVYLWFYSVALYSGFRFRLSRTRWREVSFGMERNQGLARQFTMLVFKGSLLTAATLGLYYPYFANARTKFLTEHARFGSEAFRYTGVGSEYFGLCLKGFLLSALTLGLYVPWFRLALASYRLNHTHFQQATFRINLQGGELMKYTFLSTLCVFLTTGIAYPWMKNWGLSLLFKNLEIVGEIKLSSIMSVEHGGSATGDIVADYFDIDFGL